MGKTPGLGTWCAKFESELHAKCTSFTRQPGFRLLLNSPRQFPVRATMRRQVTSMNLRSRIQRHLMAALGCATLTSVVSAAEANGNLSLPVDSAFTNSLAAVKTATGFIESRSRPGQSHWQPNLQV